MSDTVSVSVREATIKKSIITVSHLWKQYGAVAAVDDVTFSINEGEIFGIIGPNGAGKTTMVECISGLRVPDSGSITIYGLSPKEDRDELRNFVGVQLQESSLPPRIKVVEALNLFASFYSDPLDCQELLKSLRMTEKRNAKFKQLSGGQKQRLSIALALIGNPKIAILDELTTGLDPDARREVWGLIERIRDRGVTVILVTHYMDEAERLCDRVALINHGKLVANDTPAGLAASEGGDIHMQFAPSRSVDDKILAALPGVTSVEHRGTRVIVNGSGDITTHVLYALLKADITVKDIQVKSGNLEDAFVKLTQTNDKKLKPQERQ
ncbi:MAG: ABC transporter ATP-binding protein [Candidatus Bathyarchaeota archaeon]|nr:ABC transporter ATP-binding protein [Candidatus Bathyarchaeota archaeon]